MSKPLPFKKKKPIVNFVQGAPILNHKKGASIRFQGCDIRDNGIGMLLGDGVEVDMINTTLAGNGVAIVAGDLNEQFLHLLKSATVTDRFKFAQEIGDIAKCSDPVTRSQMISKSTIGQKLANIANIATVSSWLADVIDGVSTIDLDKLIQTIMG